MMPRGVREADPQTRKTKFGPTFYVFYYMYMYSMYIYIYTLYGIQDPGPCIHVTVYTDPYPVPHETTNTVYH